MRETVDSWENRAGAETYAEAVLEGRLYTTLTANLLERIDPPDDARLLDLACGTGIAASAASARSAGIEIAGLDRAGAMLRAARAAVPLPSAAWVKGAPEALPFRDATFDGVLTSAAFWHFPARRRVLEEVARVAKRGGRFALNVPAAQLADVADGVASPLQRALSREGVKQFGSPPAQTAVELERAEVLAAAREAGLTHLEDGTTDIVVEQAELVALLHVPAIGARFYPERTESERSCWIAAACARIDATERVAVRWWEVVFEA